MLALFLFIRPLLSRLKIQKTPHSSLLSRNSATFTPASSHHYGAGSAGRFFGEWRRGFGDFERPGRSVSYAPLDIPSLQEPFLRHKIVKKEIALGKSLAVNVERQNKLS